MLLGKDASRAVITLLSANMFNTKFICFAKVDYLMFVCIDICSLNLGCWPDFIKIYLYK